MKIKIKNILKKKGKQKIICLTAYSKSFSLLLDKYCDIILVGDSLANVLYGLKNTRNLDLQTMIGHARSVKSGLKKSILVVDMPKKSYTNPQIAIKNAKKVMQKTKCDAIKIENNASNSHILKALVKAKIPVMGHIGFTPQFKKKFKVEGKTFSEKRKLINSAKKIEKIGAFALVLECITEKTSNEITQALKIPTIGIGSSSKCDGQILVTDDLLGLSGFYPKFVKKYSNLEKIIVQAVKRYAKDVLLKKFPSKKNSY